MNDRRKGAPKGERGLWLVGSLGGEFVGRFTQLDLHGVRVEDVQNRVDQFLDQYIVNGGTVEIVFGIGTGAVRKEVLDYLKELKAGRGAYSIQDYKEQRISCLVVV